MPITKLKNSSLKFILTLVITILVTSLVFSQEKSGGSKPSGNKPSQTKEAPKAKLIAVLGDTDLRRELDKAESKKVERPAPEAVKGRSKVELRPGKETYELERKVFAIINRVRVESGLSELKWSDEMAEVARVHSLEMAEYNYFSHAGLDGSMVNDRADELGFSDWKAIGENIAFNQGYEKPAEFACERWMKSTSHYQNIMNKKWKESGVGVAITKDGRYYFTQVFVLNY